MDSPEPKNQPQPLSIRDFIFILLGRFSHLKTLPGHKYRGDTEEDLGNIEMSGHDSPSLFPSVS